MSDGNGVTRAPAGVEERRARWPEARGAHEPPRSLRLSGTLLGAAERLSTAALTAPIVRSVARQMLGIAALARLPDSFRGEPPDDPLPRRARSARRWAADDLAPPSRTEGWSRSIDDYRAAYAAGDATPEVIAEKAITTLMSLARSGTPTSLLAACDPEAVMKDARASTDRWRRGVPRPLEGVVFLAKDQHDVAGLPTRFGTRGPRSIATVDATQIARLREAGAIVLGKSVMTEWGISPLGTSAHVTLPSNVHAPDHVAGGSSTGSSIGVALGIGPFATAGDAGGSARVPAAWAGIFGLKPTFGRISRAGEAAWGSLSHVGVVASSTVDIATYLDIVATDCDPRDPLTVGTETPTRSFGARIGDGVRGLRIGIEEKEWEDCSPDVSTASRAALAALERDGAILVPIRIPLARHGASLGIATIGCEGVALSASVPQAEQAHLAADIRLAMAVASGVTGSEYLRIQQLRIGLRQQVAAALRTVDVLALPVVPTTAPRLDARERSTPFSDVPLILSVCRHTFLANLTGLPASSSPIGFDRSGVPMGLQLVADAWDEDALLAVMAHLERAGVSRVRRPALGVDLLAQAL